MQSPLNHSPVTVIDNAQFLTQDPQNPHAQAVAIIEGKIVALDDAARQFSHARRIDAGGAIITPGFNDAHAHTVWFGQTLLEIDLSHASSPEDVYESIYQALDVEDSNGSEKADTWVISSVSTRTILKVPT